MTSSQITASSSLAALTAAADAAARAALHTLNVPGRERHSERAQKPARNPAYLRHQADDHRETPGHRVRAQPRINRPGRKPARKEEPPRPPGPRPVEPRARPAATRGQHLCPHAASTTTETDSMTETRHQECNYSAHPKHKVWWGGAGTGFMRLSGR